MTPEHVGPYAILETLGAGGMGTVYLGRHKETGQVAAVKVLPASLAREEGFVERFNREIEALQKIVNPHTVRLYDHGVDHETYYYAMEYVPGDTVMSILRREKRIPWERAVDIAIQICQALKAAHDAGVIHRDLKPSNLLIAPDGTVKLTDFGVAQVFAAGRLTVTGGIIGTAEYMSPEQAQGKRVTKQSDLYSLGAVLYVMTTGRPPFPGNTAVDIIQKHRFGMFDRPRLIVPEIPVWLEDIIIQLLEKEPEKRFPDARVLMRKLQDMLDRSRESISSDVTLAEGQTADSDAPTVVSLPGMATAGTARGRPGMATMMREAVRAELEEQASPLQSLFNNTWVLVLALVLVVGGAVWFVTRPGANSAETIDETNDLDARLRKLQLALKLKKEFIPADDARRLLLQVQDAIDRGDRATARKIAAGLAALLASDPAHEQERELAELLVSRLDEQFAEERYAALTAAVKRAESLEKAGKSQSADAVWHAIVDLYGSDPDARAHVERARDALGLSAIKKAD